MTYTTIRAIRRKKVMLNHEEIISMFERGWTQTDIANHLGCASAAIRKILVGYYKTSSPGFHRGKRGWTASPNKSTTKYVNTKRNVKQLIIIRKLLYTTKNYATIAREQNVSRERVGQVADGMYKAGFELTPRPKNKIGRQLTRGFPPEK